VFKNYDITIQNMFHDTQIAQHILNENESSLALKELVTKYLKLPSDTFGTLFGNDTPFNTLPLDVALVYAAKDSDITNQLYKWQMTHFKRLPNLLDYYREVENPLIEVLIDMERTGFTLDKEYAETYRIELEGEIKELEKELETYFGGINLQSPAQLKAKLEEITGKKLESTDAKKVLKPLKDKFVQIETLLKYKDLVKLHSTYIDALPKKVKGDGRIHPSFGQSNTVTGRLNSSNPNFQNLGERARKMFIAPKGKVILAGDFS
jgi:DNA polymerase-1